MVARLTLTLFTFILLLGILAEAGHVQPHRDATGQALYRPGIRGRRRGLEFGRAVVSDSPAKEETPPKSDTSSSSSSTTSATSTSSSSSTSTSTSSSTSTSISTSTSTSSSTTSSSSSSSSSSTSTSSSSSSSITSPTSSQSTPTNPSNPDTDNQPIQQTEQSHSQRTSTVTDFAAAASPTQSSDAQTSHATKTKTISLTVIIALVASIGGVSILWTIFRKWKLRRSERFDRRLQPIVWPNETDVNDGSISSHRLPTSDTASFRSGAYSVHSEKSNGVHPQKGYGAGDGRFAAV